MKPGYKTSEFWLTLAPWLLAGIALVLAATGTLDGETVRWLLGFLVGGGSLSNVGYAGSRGRVKAQNK